MIFKLPFLMLAQFVMTIYWAMITGPLILIVCGIWMLYGPTWLLGCISLLLGLIVEIMWATKFEVVTKYEE